MLRPSQHIECTFVEICDVQSLGGGHKAPHKGHTDIRCIYTLTIHIGILTCGVTRYMSILKQYIQKYNDFVVDRFCINIYVNCMINRFNW